MITRPRGTRDILHPKSFIYQQINFLCCKFLNLNNYKQVILPTYEYHEVFNSSLGNFTDVIRKEMFLFSDKKNRSLVLRPEGTVGVVRLVSQNELLKKNDYLKLFYWANMFRYERPQQGRYREFWQLGVEIINSEGTLADCEVLNLAKCLLENLGLKDCIFSINYLGDEETRNRYKQILKSSLLEKIEKLCAGCRIRYQNNPLRIMDCDNCNILKEIPKYSESWSANDHSYLMKVTSTLSEMKFNYVIDQKLVRGLDYYNGIVFEIKSAREKKTLVGGGRYDNLFNEFIGKKIPAVGFALGIDRLIEFFYDLLLAEIKDEKNIDLLLISLDETSIPLSFWLKNNISSKLNNSKIEFNLMIKKKKKFFDLINTHKPKLAVFIGEKEIKSNLFSIRDVENKKNFLIDKNEIVKWIVKRLNG